VTTPVPCYKKENKYHDKKGGSETWTTDLGSQHVLHRQDVDLGMERVGRLDFSPDKLGTVDLGQQLEFATVFEDALEGHVARCTGRADVRLVVGPGVDTVFDRGADEAVSLAVSNSSVLYQQILLGMRVYKHVHRLRPQRSSDEERLTVTQLTLQLGLGGVRPGNGLHLETGVLLGTDALTLGTVVVHAGLAVFGAVDCVALAKLDLAETVELVDLPADERIVVRVRGCREERAAPVDTRTERVVIRLLNK
jgi:hypothetical protein